MEFKKRTRIITVKEFRTKFSTDEDCLKHLVELRWPNGFVCPKCHNQEFHWQTGDGTKPGYVAIRIVESLSSILVKDFVGSKIVLGSTVETDGLSVYGVLNGMDFIHEAYVTENGTTAKELFPWVHLVIGNLKRFILGTHHHADPKYLRFYVSEYCYRLNRRFHEDDLFEHLLKACLLVSPRKHNILGY